MLNHQLVETIRSFSDFSWDVAAPNVYDKLVKCSSALV